MGYIAIVDYGAGNLMSVHNTLDFLGYENKVASTGEVIENAAGVILPGVGAFPDLKAALEKRMAYFHENNCRLSDHGLNYVVYEPADDAAIEAIFAKKAAGETLTDTEVAQFKTAMLLFCAAQYKKLNWTMQLHYGCRLPRTDSGYVPARLLGFSFLRHRFKSRISVARFNYCRSCHRRHCLGQQSRRRPLVFLRSLGRNFPDA